MSKIAITKSSGNVFADIGVPNAKQHLVKARLVSQLSKSIKELKLTQADAAKRLGLSQPDVSKLLRGHFQMYSIDRLMLLLTKLGQNVTIGVQPASKKTGKLVVHVEPV